MANDLLKDLIYPDDNLLDEATQAAREEWLAEHLSPAMRQFFEKIAEYPNEGPSDTPHRGAPADLYASSVATLFGNLIIAMRAEGFSESRTRAALAAILYSVLTSTVKFAHMNIDDVMDFLVDAHKNKRFESAEGIHVEALDDDDDDDTPPPTSTKVH